MKNQLLLSLFSVAFVCQSANADIITFDFRNSDLSGLLGQSSGSTSASSGGITLTLTAQILTDGGGGGVFTRNINDGLGIDHPATTDDGASFDNGAGPEVMQFSLSSNVLLDDLTFTSIGFRLMGTTDTARLTTNADPFEQFTGSAIEVDVWNLGKTGIMATDIFRLNAAFGDSFAVDSFVFNATAAAVPEPSSLLVLIPGGFAFFCYRSRRNRNLA